MVRPLRTAPLMVGSPVFVGGATAWAVYVAV
jgi:hypothetical protein